jgi:uncharacterized membrane protein YgcG
MWIQIKRIVRHGFAKGWRNYLSEDAMQRLTGQVAACEKVHSGEIRICIESSLPQSYLLRSETMPAIIRQRALAKFAKLRVWDTEHNNGVLIYLLVPERAIELVADRGINACVADNTWKKIVNGLQACLQKGQFEEGLRGAVLQVSSELSTYFPLPGDGANMNELPDRPDVGESDGSGN